jgi:hypothetical protein
MLTRKLIIVVASATLVAMASNTAMARSTDMCEHQRKALQSHSVKPLMSQQTKNDISDCAADTIKGALDSIFKRPSKKKSDCIENVTDIVVDESTDNWVDNQFQQFENRKQVQDMLDENATAQVATANSISTAITWLRDCRVREVEQIQTRREHDKTRIEAMFQSDRITYDQRDKEFGKIARRASKDLDAVADRVEADNELIAEVIGRTGENLEVLQASSETLASIDAAEAEDVGPDGDVYTPGGSGAIDSAVVSQRELEEQQQTYADLLAQIEEEKSIVNEDV